MKRFLKDYRLHEHTEALFLLTLGIIIQVLDGSPFDVWDRWSLAWETEFPREYFSAISQKIIKTVLSIIILVRCMTTVLYVLFGLIVIYSILRETSPKLMLPWLFISGLKSVLLTFFETLTGVYVCSALGKVRKPCVEFVVSKAIELFFAIYLWASIRSIHKDLEQYEENYREEELLTKMVIHRVHLRRRRARSMIDESTLQKTCNLNFFSLTDVPNIIFDMLKTEEELSQDSLLSPGMMLASVSNMGSYDYLKTSMSLGELGSIDLSSFQVAGLDDHRHLCPSVRAMKFLKLTRDDIIKARERTRSKTFLDNYRVPKYVPRSLVKVNPSTVLNRLPRQNELFAAKLPDLEKVKEHLSKIKKRRKFQEDILSDSFDESSQMEVRTSTEQLIDLEEDDGYEEKEGRSTGKPAETDGEATPDMWFMTNKKDEVNRIRLVEADSSKRSDHYERLYRQDYMNIIGKEVFDRASKLVKLTSLDDVNSGRGHYEKETSLEYPSTNRDSESQSSKSSEDSKRTKTKTIGFHLGRSTAMPLSVIVTNFPIQLDSSISKCKPMYYREMVASSAEILLLPDSSRAIEPRLEIDDGESSSSEVEEIVSDPSSVLIDPEDRSVSEDGKFRESLADARDLTNCGKVNLYMLKCSRGTSPDFWYDHPKTRQPGTKFPNCRRPTAHRNLTVFEREEQEFPLIRSIDGSFSGCDGCYIYPRISEQMMFIRDMMRRPLRDVLRSYYNLREVENELPGLKRISSSDSVQFGNGLTAEPIDRVDVVEYPSRDGKRTNSSNNKSTVDLFSLEKRTFADCETQVSFGENGLRSTETVSLGSPMSKKLKTKENDRLPPLYLFGNKDLGWSSSPLQIAAGGTQEKSSNSRQGGAKGSETNRTGMIHSHSFPEGSTAKGFANISSTSETSFRMVLPPNQRNTLEEDSLSSQLDQISMEVISDDVCTAESDESFSLFYSKTADLASPLLDTRRFIYPDHIHYSYKNVKKKGFDVELNGGLPLLVRDSLTLNSSMNVKRIDTPPDPQTGITRRPMDLTFANLDLFPEREQQPEPSTSQAADAEKDEANPTDTGALLTDQLRELKNRSKTVKKEKKWLKKFFREEKSTNPDDFHRGVVETSSTNLHTNKRGVGVRNNLAVGLQSNKLKEQEKSRLKNVAGTI